MDKIYNLSPFEIIVITSVLIYFIFYGIAKFYKAQKKLIYITIAIASVGLAFASTSIFIYPWYQIKQIEYLANRNLPKNLNENTILEKIKITHSTYHYFYTIIDNDQEFDFDKSFARPKEEIFETELVGTFCTILKRNQKVENLLATYTYKGKTVEFSFTQNDCNK
ncbi:hypothetical protein [Bartonella sp. HY406]|uniref:hypothetical protein n=1 Tax=Bartonella sp. HY406 TaxID=2979331 RepID=UPI0021C5F6F7|nr:hypothetical protein [Bartonella sp. HY406]UXN03058.1 hypothetical protein N6B01_11385 [Bartonella sp. HY406]